MSVYSKLLTILLLVFTVAMYGIWFARGELQLVFVWVAIWSGFAAVIAGAVAFCWYWTHSVER